MFQSSITWFPMLSPIYCPRLQFYLCGSRMQLVFKFDLNRWHFSISCIETRARHWISLWLSLFHHKMELALPSCWVAMKNGCDPMWEYLWTTIWHEPIQDQSEATEEKNWGELPKLSNQNKYLNIAFLKSQTYYQKASMRNKISKTLTLGMKM